MNGLLVLALLFAVFWFMLIRPQRARAREQQELIASLEPGDEIVTAGGMYGVISAVEGDILHLEIAEGLVVRTARNSVAGIVEEVEADADEQVIDAEEGEEGGEGAEESAEATEEADLPDAERRH